MAMLYLHIVQVVYSISSKIETFNYHEVEYESNLIQDIDQKMSDGNLSFEIWKEEKRRKWKLDIKFENYCYKYFVFHKAIKA